MTAGKGSKSRPLSVSDKEYSANWDSIFSKSKPTSDVSQSTTLLVSKVDPVNPYTDSVSTGNVSSANIGGSLTVPTTMYPGLSSSTSTPQEQCPFRWLEYPSLGNSSGLQTSKVLQYRTVVDGKYVWIDVPKVLFQDSVI